MAVTTEDILQRLQASLRSATQVEPQPVNVGTVASVGDGVARLEG
jgi:F-type H+-transporting ATPase subunit alpha